jgi:mono/diheme cytochrome c family protein
LGLNEEKRMTEFEDFQKAQQIEVGAGLFEINCRGCHGTRGEGIAGLAPALSDEYFFNQRLQEVGWQGTKEDYIISTIASGRQISTRPELYPGAGNPAMPTWSEQFGGPLRVDQIEDIASFIMNWEPTALGLVEITELHTPTPRLEELDDPVARGQVVFEQNGCGGCHTIESLSAGAVGPNLTQIGEVAATRIEGVSAEDYILKSITDPSAYIVEGYEDLMLKTYADTLNQQAVDDLTAFLLTQK